MRCTYGKLNSENFVDYLFVLDVQKLANELGLYWTRAVQPAYETIAV